MFGRSISENPSVLQYKECQYHWFRGFWSLQIQQSGYLSTYILLVRSISRN